MTTALDLGCGLRPKNPFGADVVYGIDVRDDAALGVVRADLVIEPIPFPDESFDFISAHDFVEHIPRIVYVPQRRHAFVELMNEIYRVLKPGGCFLSMTPAYPKAEAFRDPTHVNIITEETFPLYFDETRRWASPYGFAGAFVVMHQEWRGPHLMSLLRRAEPPTTSSNLF